MAEPAGRLRNHRRPLVFALTVAVAIGAPPKVITAQDILPIADPPTCACVLQISLAFTIADPDGRAGLSSPVTMSRTSAGEILIVPSVSQGQILVFDSTGHFIRRIGRTGRGPGEYLGIMDIEVGPQDTVFILDTSNARLAVLDPRSFTERRFVMLPDLFFQLGVTGESRFVTAGQAGEHLVHLSTPDLEPVRSFVNVPVRRHGDRRSEERRRIAVSPDGLVAVAHYNDYRIEIWDSTGRHVRTLERQADWFPAGRESGVSREAPRQKPNPGLLTPRFDNAGRLWTVARVADENWNAAIQTVTGAYDRPETGVPQGSQSAYWDSVVEVVTAETGELIATARIDAYLTHMLPGGYAASYREDEVGNPYVDIWRLQLRPE